MGVNHSIASELVIKLQSYPNCLNIFLLKLIYIKYILLDSPRLPAYLLNTKY